MNLLLGVTGGIAAYKACELVSLALKSGCQIEVMMTNGACQFIGPLSFEGLTGKAPHVDTFSSAMAHIELGKWADVCCIAPLSAHTLAKLANGLCDDMLSTTILALPSNVPLILAPAMNTNMWNHPMTQHNLKKCQELSAAKIIDPVEKRLACGDYGVGGLAAPQDIMTIISNSFIQNS